MSSVVIEITILFASRNYGILSAAETLLPADGLIYYTCKTGH